MRALLSMLLAALAAAMVASSAAPAPAQNTAPQYFMPQYPALPQYPAEAYETFLQRSQVQQHPSQQATEANYPRDRNYGSAAVSDSGPNYCRPAETDPSWILRQHGMAAGQNTNGATQNGWASMGSNGRATTGLNGAANQNVEAVAAGDDRRAPARFVSAAKASETASTDDASTSSDNASTSSNSNCSCSSCGSSGCGCDSCGSDSCDSCDCESCQHKCQPLIQIDECCPLTCDDQPADRYFDDCCWLKCHDTTITGWFDGGIMGNGRATADHFNGPLTFPDRRGEGQANQMWLSIDRSAPADNCDWFIGGHMDYFFGSDYFFTTAAGLDGTRFGNLPRWNTTDSFLYGFAMPQLYAETDYGTDTKIKWGHFFTIIGYEVVPAIGNFFYSHSYTMQYGEPFTHTGMLASRSSGNWTGYAGMTAGWNTFDADDRAGFLGGLTYTDKDWGSLAVAVTTGDDSEFNFAGVGPFANRTMYSLAWSRNFTSRFTYVLQHDWGTQNDAQTFQGSGAEWFGINQYMFYRLNCCWTAGLRAEWFRDDDGFVVTGLRPGNAIGGASFPGNFYEITAGLNYKPNGNLVIRPEVRWDWYDGETNQNPFVPATLPYDAGTRSNQFTYGVDLVYQW